MSWSKLFLRKAFLGPARLVTMLPAGNGEAPATIDVAQSLRPALFAGAAR